MKKKNKLSWTFEGESFEVGECIIEPYNINLNRDKSDRPIVFYRGNVFILRSWYNNKCFLVSIYQDFSVWAKCDYVFQVLKVFKNENIQRKSLSAK
jgi:hypothetical protein